MTEAETVSILDWLAGGFNERLSLQTELVWKAELADKDYGRALEIATEIVRTGTRFPAVSEFRHLYHRRAGSAPAFTRPSCPTCNDDRMVVVGIRKPKQSVWMREHDIDAATDSVHEEYAPCPDCNPSANAAFKRADGTWARPPDPARTRELMNQ